jgi:hypothetical protein
MKKTIIINIFAFLFFVFLSCKNEGISYTPSDEGTVTFKFGQDFWSLQDIGGGIAYNIDSMKSYLDFIAIKGNNDYEDYYQYYAMYFLRIPVVLGKHYSVGSFHFFMDKKIVGDPEFNTCGIYDIDLSKPANSSWIEITSISDDSLQIDGKFHLFLKSDDGCIADSDSSVVLSEGFFTLDLDE